MYRVPRNTDLGTSNQVWKGMQWDVTMHLNSRQSVTSIHVVCVRTFDDGHTVEGFSSQPVAPFDDLRRVVQDLAMLAAIDTQDTPSHEEHELPLWPAS